MCRRSLGYSGSTRGRSDAAYLRKWRSRSEGHCSNPRPCTPVRRPKVRGSLSRSSYDLSTRLALVTKSGLPETAHSIWPYGRDVVDVFCPELLLDWAVSRG